MLSVSYQCVLHGHRALFMYSRYNSCLETTTGFVRSGLDDDACCGEFGYVIK